MECQKCHYDNRQGVKFCEKCGARMELVCPNCGARIPTDTYFCGECGHELKKPVEAPPLDYSRPDSYTPKHLVDKILHNRSSIEGERKIVTVLFADVANYTSMAEKIDPEEVHTIMDGCFKILMDEIHRYEGTINQFTGDGVMALFGAPVAHEAHANRACSAALSIQRALGPYEEKLVREHGLEFKMRIGLNSGPVIVGSIGDDLRMDYTAVGDTTNLAARIQQAASPRQVCISEETRNLIKDFFKVKPLGEINLKGKSEPQPIYSVVAEHKGVRTRFEAGVMRGFTELVGRRPEMEALQAEFQKSKTGEARIVDVVGEAGIGKTRLIYELRKRLGEDVTFLSGACIQYGRNINFLPLIDIVKAAFGIEEEMSEQEAGNRIAQRSAGNLAPMIPFYRNLLSLKVEDSRFLALEPEGRKFGTFEAVKNLLLALSKERPLVIFVEDVHWIDKISEEFFTFFTRCMTDHPILMLAAYRPEGAPPWTQSAHYQRVGLETLSSKSSIRLVHNILGGLLLDPSLEQKIVEKTGGNPFFVEEIVRELQERGDLARAGDRYISTKPIDQLEIPNTIQGVLAARMDRLSEDLKRTMQVASVIGRDFAFKILKSVMALGTELRTSLTNLVGLEILYEKALFPELEYIFKHALTQEVAYQSLLKQRRQEIHERIAKAIEELYVDRLEEHYELLAHHYRQSGNALKAVDYLILAGEKSNQHSAAQAAHEFFSKAIEMVEGKELRLSAETEVRLHQGWAQASQELGALGKAMEGHRKTIGISRRHGLLEYEKRSLVSLAMFMFAWHDREEAKQILEEGISRAREIGDKVMESLMISSASTDEMSYRSASKGLMMGMEAERIAAEAGDPVAIFIARTFQGWPERWLGRPAKTIELTEGALELLKSENLMALTKIIQNRSVALAEVGRIEEGIATLKNIIEVSEKFGPFLFHASLFNSLGYCYSEIHQYEKAWELNLESEEIAKHFIKKYPIGRSQYGEIAAHATVNLMENLFDQGRIDEAWNRMKSFQEESRSDDYDMVRYVWESRMNYLVAQILLKRNDIGQAEASIERGLERARIQGLKKREGAFLRLLGDVQSRLNQSENAIENINKAIVLLKEVGNPRHLWQAHTSLASVYDKLGRVSDARDKWGEAAEIIRKTAKGLSDRGLRESFLKARPIVEILSKAEN